MTIVFEGDGDLLTSSCETLVCPVNTVGTLGNGLAAAFKWRYPGLLEAYKGACKRSVFSGRGLYLWEYLPDRKILCLPTKRHFANPSKLIWIDKALEILAADWEELGITSLGIPMIGCGKGELVWNDVRPLIWQHLDPIDLEVSIFLK